MMKIPLIYAAFMAIASAAMTFFLFFLGYHSDATKLAAVQAPSGIAAIALTVTGIVLGMRAQRAEVPAAESFRYGRALGTGVLIGVFASLFSGIFNLLYQTAINPDFSDVMTQLQTAELEAKGMNADQVEAAEGVMRMMMKPAVQFVFVVLGGALVSVAISLVAAAFIKRPDRKDTAPTLE